MTVWNNGYSLNIQQKYQANMPVQKDQTKNIQFSAQQNSPEYKAVDYNFAPMMKQQVLFKTTEKSLAEYFPSLRPITESSSVNKVIDIQKTNNIEWKNDLRSLFKENKSVIFALIPRTFTAEDKDGDELIDLSKGEMSGTWTKAIGRLDELKHYGINTLHILPIHPPGEKMAMGTAGSIYAPETYLKIDPLLDDLQDPRSVEEELKAFTAECHKRDIRVMIDLPSCASVDLYEKRPELMAIDAKGFPKVPQGWKDIRMFEPWEDKDKRILHKPLLDYHKKWIDMCLELGIDGARADVARAKPVEFWNELIPYAREKDPGFAFLAESYTYEDASPMMNMPFDRPKDLLKSGFDSYYGQYHIFHLWNKADDLHNYVKENISMSNELNPGKSLIGSFATHDDNSPMSHGGVPFCNLTTGLQSTLPMTNPYFVSGFESGDKYIYTYANKTAAKSLTNNFTYKVHPEWIDIFNLSRKPGGKHPEIGEYMHSMMKLRNENEDVITKGSYIPLKTTQNSKDQIIAYARHYNGKTLLVIANKDANSRQTGFIKVPGLKQTQKLKDMSPSYGVMSGYSSMNDKVMVNLGPARLHVFEIDTPNIEKNAGEIFRQNLNF